MRRILLWFLTTTATVVLLLGYRTSTSSAPPDTVADGDTTTRTTVSTPAVTTGFTGAVTGTTASTRWGPVQVRVTLTAGRITAVDVVAQPDGNHKDQEINADAVPQLVSETLDAQSAHVDVVSGATVTSDGYVESLQSALDQAGAR